MKFCFRNALLFLLLILLGRSSNVIEHPNERILQDTSEENAKNNDWEPIRIQYKIAQLYYEYEYQKFFQKLFSVAQTFITRYFLVQRLTEVITFDDTDDKYFDSEQISIQYLSESFETDLLIFVQIYDDSTTNVKASSEYIKTYSKTQRPTVGIIKWNIYSTNLKNMTNSEFELNMQRLIATTMYIMGFTPKAFQTYFDSSINVKYSNPSITINNITYLSTPRIKKIIQQHFKCDTVKGAQLENDGGNSYAKNHLERSIFYNEILTSATMEGNMIISDFTFSIFQDTGFYNLMQYSPDKVLWGKGKGCDFLQKRCYGDFQEFCNVENEEGCSFLNTGYSNCKQDDFSDQCKYFQIKQDYDCRDSTSGGDEAKETFQHFGSDSMCIVGSISENYSVANKQKFSCFQYLCDANNQLTLIINSKSFNCLSQQTIKIDQYFGQVSCPKNPEEFCRSQDECMGQCNQRGYCLNKMCICSLGYSGKGCQENCSKYRHNAECYDKCPSKTYPIEAIQYCVGCPGNCQDCSSYNKCKICLPGYKLNSIGFCDILYNYEVPEEESEEESLPTNVQEDEQYLILEFTFEQNNAYIFGASLAFLTLL
ncbi:unnamed protein product [Paramecium sonneborni]|uniref:EGF-like domain-containing protein n=1 Tax=Paramecium sonneborni TaxID=65129 RepID=A0A8S1QSX1_9CILI|nr:unnamed protein product [Paramecium sonneborni]